jgi:hypothetical protein
MPHFTGTRTSSRQPNNTPATRGLTRDFTEANKGGLNQLTASLTFTSGTAQISGANGTFSSFGAVGDRVQVEGTSMVNDGGFLVTAIDATNHAFLTVAPPPKSQGPLSATLRKIT